MSDETHRALRVMSETNRTLIVHGKSISVHEPYAPTERSMHHGFDLALRGLNSPNRDDSISGGCGYQH
eukprot:6213037-Pleurochrysis_carterae.AAC.3